MNSKSCSLFKVNVEMECNMPYLDVCIMSVVQDRLKRATVGPLPGVTQDIAGFKVKRCFVFSLVVWGFNTFALRLDIFFRTSLSGSCCKTDCSST